MSLTSSFQAFKQKNKLASTQKSLW